MHLIAREPFTLVDVGPLTEVAWDALRHGLARHGLAPSDVKRVLLTHGHHDHYGLARRVAKASGAEILGGRLDRDQFAMDRDLKPGLDAMARAGFGIAERFMVVASRAWVDTFGEPAELTGELSGGETLRGDGYTIRVRSTPGHTPGSLTFEVPEAGVLFTGDTVLKKITPNAVVVEDPEKRGQPFRSVTRYMETLDRLAEEDGGATLLTGHGASIPSFREHAHTVSRRYRDRRARIEAELAKGPRNARELVAALFPFVARLNLFLAFSEIQGFLMYLEDLGVVEKLSGVYEDRYRLAAPAA